MISPSDSPERKLLIVAYYWPPSGGSGVQRWLKFVKYLPSFGWTPYVFTPENPSVEGRDESLLKDVPKEAVVIHFPIWEPYGLFRKTSSLVKKPVRQIDLVSTGKRGVFQSITTWIREFVPRDIVRHCGACLQSQKTLVLPNCQFTNGRSDVRPY